MPLDLEQIKERAEWIDAHNADYQRDILALIERVEELEREWKYVEFHAQVARECLLNPGGAGTAAFFVEAIEERARRALSENNQEDPR